MKAGMMGTSRRTTMLFLAISGTAGIASLFLPFTSGVSPAWVIRIFFPIKFDSWFIFSLAAPFFLAFLISAAFLRWMISGFLSRPERIVAYVLSTMMACGTLLYIILGFIEFISDLRPDVQIWFVLFIPLLTLSFGVFTVIKNLRNNGTREVNALITMQTAYLSNALLCLIMFFEGWQSGAYCVAVTSALYLIQIVLTSAKLEVFRRGSKMRKRGPK